VSSVAMVSRESVFVCLQNLGRIGDAVGFYTKIGILAGNTDARTVDDLAGIEGQSL
jgi:hypothetical protein